MTKNTNQDRFLSNLEKLYPKVEETWALLYNTLNDLDVPEFGPYELFSSSVVEILDYVKDAEKKMYSLLSQLDDLNNKINFMNNQIKKGKQNDKEHNPS